MAYRWYIMKGKIWLICGLIILALAVTILPVVTAQEQCYDKGKKTQGEIITISQPCPTCTYVNLTEIEFPNGTTQVVNSAFNNSGTSFTHLFADTNFNGELRITVKGNKGGTVESETFCYLIQPGGSNSIIIYILIAVILYSVTLIGFFGRNEIISILGGMFMIAFGIFTVNNGIILFRDWITNYFAYFTLGLGAIISIWAAIEWIQETM